MRVAIHQTAGTPRSPESNLAALASTARRAAEQGAELLLLPEMWLTGYNIGDSARELAEPADGRSAKQVAAIASEAGLAILYGYPERSGDHVYNAAQLITPDGRRPANMRKAHLFGTEERRLFTPGDTGLPVVDWAGIRIGILICYDVEFPEAVRSQALRGAELIAVPTALFQPYSIIATHVVAARAFESQVFVAYANRCGEEGTLRYTGRSSIRAPDGEPLAEADEDERLLVAEIDPQVVVAGRVENPYLADRRPELYSGTDQPV